MADKLREPRIRRVIAVLLAGEESELGFAEDDLQYIADLGLIERKPELRISNRIYREVIPREITAPIQDGIHQERGWYLTVEHKERARNNFPVSLPMHPTWRRCKIST